MPPAPQFDPLGASVAGSADLQGSIDRLDSAVRTLTVAIQGQTNGNGTTTSPAISQAAAGSTFTSGSFGAGNNGSGGTSGTNPFSMGGGSILGGGSGAFSLTQIAANLASGAINAESQMGVQQLNNQAQMNTYGYTQAGFWNASYKSTVANAFGGYNGGLYQNNMATSAADARFGGSLLSQMEGQATFTGNMGRGNSPFQAAALTAMANPGLGMTGAAGVSGALFNPNTSYNLMMMGVNTTPLQLGTGRANSIANVEASIGQRFNFGGYNAKTGTFSSQSLASNLDNPLFQYQMMQATGMTQAQYNEWSQSWAQANTWTQKAGGGTTMNQMQQEIAAYMNGGSGQRAATSWLKSHGVTQSMLQSLTQEQAGQTATEAGGNQAFVSGLQDATQAINALTNQLAKGIILQAKPQGGAAGIAWGNSNGVSGAGGFGGTMGTLASGLASFSSFLGSISGDINSILGSGGGTSIQNSGNVVGGGGGGGGGGVASGANNRANQAIGKRLAAQWGWSGKEWTDLNNLVMHESGWNNYAQNPTSTAFGIGQFLDSTWAGTGYKKTYDATTQIIAMLNYIKGRYGDPAKAWSGYFGGNLGGPTGYANGTNNAAPGYALVGERGPEMVKLSGGQQIMNAAQTFNAVQAPWTTGKAAQYLFSPITGGQGGGGVHISFDKGSIVMGGGGGFHTSTEVNTQADQFVQALEKAMMKSTVLQKIAAGVTG